MQPFAHCALIIVRFACSVSKSCLTLCSTMDCSLPGSPVLGTLQARILERVAFPSPGHLPNPGIEPMSPVSPALAGRFFTTEPPKEALRVYLCSNKLSLYFLNLFASSLNSFSMKNLKFTCNTRTWGLKRGGATRRRKGVQVVSLVSTCFLDLVHSVRWLSTLMTSCSLHLPLHVSTNPALYCSKTLLTWLQRSSSSSQSSPNLCP